MTTRLSRGALACALLATSAACGLTAAHAQQNAPPKKEYYIGEGEVELHRGTFMYTNTDISIGGGENEGGLAFTRYAGVREYGSTGPAGGHNLEVAVYSDRFREDGMGPGLWSYHYYVVNGRSVEQFDQYYGSSTIWQNGATGTLTRSSANGPFVYTARDGTVINFATLSTCPSLFVTTQCGVGTSIVRPNGETTSFAYDTAGGITRPRLATTNRGFGMGLEYDASGRVSRVCAVNLAQSYASATAPCPAGAPSATYTAGTDPATYIQWSTFTDAAGQTTHYTYGDWGGMTSIRGPGSTVNDLTVAYNSVTGRVASQTYANGAAWTYAYQQWEHPHTSGHDGNDWTEVTSPLGHKVFHDFAYGQPPKPGSVKDPLNRVTQFRWVGRGLLEKKIEPEGNYVQHTYDARDNVTQIRQVAKTGSGLADLVSTTAFPASCANIKTCNKPTSSTDARGHTTDFTYDSTHGGVLTETGAAVNGVRPQTRYFYQQKYGWVKNSAGTLVQAAAPVWVLTSKSVCKTGNASGNGCAIGGDEVITSYDWGTTPGPLLLRGVVEDAGGINARTCYGYDERGNKISETSPVAGLTSCP